jgi:arginase family enzyme
MQVIKKLIGERPVHVSFDIDSLDPTEAPATGTPVRGLYVKHSINDKTQLFCNEGGLTYREGVYICRALQEFNTVSMDLVEINPLLGIIIITIILIITIIVIIDNVVITIKKYIYFRE